ncbi:DUF1648 domain-containing protein [Thermococcus sp.]
MNERTFEVFISLFLLGTGLLTLALRNRRNRFVGFRVGYTYHSDKVWRKVNTLTGAISVVYSLFLLGLALHGVSPGVFVFLIVAFVFGVMIIGVQVARREYELEELSREAPEKPPLMEIEGESPRPYLVIQLLLLLVYLSFVAVLWGNLSERVAVHFNASGEPNGYMDKFWGLVGVPVLIWLIPFSLTLLGKDRMLLARMSAGINQRGWFEFNTLMGVGIVAMSFTVLLYNLGKIQSNAITLATFGFLALMAFGTYRLLRVR